MSKKSGKKVSTSKVGKKVANRSSSSSKNQRAHGTVKSSTSGTGSTGPKIKPTKKN